MFQIFVGFDERQPVSYNVLQHTINEHATRPVRIAPLIHRTLPIDRTGLTPFTFTRWLVPWLCDFKGWALFMDADMLVLDDITVLELYCDDQYAVRLVKNPRLFEWPSLMLFNCGHKALKALTPEYVEGGPVFKWDFLEGRHDSPLIGDLPSEWNHLVGYDEPRKDAKVVHFTSGIPAFDETSMSEYAVEWQRAHQMMNAAVTWQQLMGNSIHATHLPDGRVLPHFHPDVLAYQAKQVASAS